MNPFDHAWSLLKAAGRMSPVGGSKESQPTGRYLDRTKGGPPMEQWRSPVEGEKRAGINPREMVEEAEPPTDFQPSDYQQADPGAGALLDMQSTRLQEEMMRELEQQGDGPPVSSGYGQIPIEQKVEEARGYVPGGEYAGPAPTIGHDSSGIRGEDDSSIYSGWKDFEPDVAPLSQEIYRHR